MRSTFLGLEISKTGLFTAQRQMDVTGHNIANVDTAGYTRQRINTSSIEPSAALGRFAPATRGTVGGGVRIDMVDQIRSSFLDRQYRNQQPSLSNWDKRAQGLGYIEAIFNEAADQSLTASIHKFFLSFNELAEHPEDKGQRTATQQLAELMVDTFHHYYDQLITLQKEQDRNMQVLVDDINTLASRISDLNVQITSYELGGEQANDLRDKRNLLMDELSKLTDYSYYEQEGQLTIKIGDRTLVQHDKYNQLVARQDYTNPIPDTAAPMLTGIYWAQDNPGTAREVTFQGGEIKAAQDLARGENSDHVGIPYLVGKLNELAKAVAAEVNNLHRGGWTFPYTDQNGVQHDSVNGTDFFKIKDGDTVFTAGNIDLADAIRTDVSNIAIADKQQFHPIGSPDNAGLGRQQVALDIGKLLDKKDIPTVGSLLGAMSTLVAGLGVQTNKANDMADSEDIITANILYNRTSIMGVNIDEELTNLIKFNHAYGASSRMITAMDEMLDVMINRMGLVGRS